VRHLIEALGDRLSFRAKNRGEHETGEDHRRDDQIIRRARRPGQRPRIMHPVLDNRAKMRAQELNIR